MQKLRTQRGITLIALIITIIVMLILVGVTVSVSLNGGLFTTAKQATNKTQLELDKEQLLELALGAMDKEGNVDSEDITKSRRFTYADGVYTSVKSGNKFTVGKWGNIALAPETPAGPEEPDPEEPETPVEPEETVYELSGKWEFIDEPGPEDLRYTEGVYLSQEITVIAWKDNGEWVDPDPDEVADEEWIPKFELSTYNSIQVIYEDGESLDGEYWLHIYVGDTRLYTAALHSWGLDYGCPDGCNVVDFGSEPQEVSKEFYDWFTANATEVTSE